MSAITLERGTDNMAKRGAASATIKIDPVLLRKAKRYCALEEVKLQDYFDRLLRGPIERDDAKAVQKLVSEQNRKPADAD